MRDELPTIDARGSGVVGSHAVVSGYAAAIITRLVRGNWRAWLVDERIVGEDLGEVEAAMSALEAVAAAWRAEQLAERTSPRGNLAPVGEGQRKPGAPQSREWFTTSEAAEMLGVSRRRVRQLVDEGSFRSTTEGGRLYVDAPQVLSLRKLRSTR